MATGNNTYLLPEEIQMMYFHLKSIGDDVEELGREVKNHIINLKTEMEKLKAINLEKGDIEAITREVKGLRSNINEEIEDLKVINEKLGKENEELKRQITELETDADKYKLVVYGFNGTETEIKDAILKFLTDELKIPCSVNDFRDIRPLAEEEEGTARPILIEVVHYQLKIVISNRAEKNKTELIKRKILIAQDYTLEKYWERKLRADRLRATEVISDNVLIKDHSPEVNEGVFKNTEIEEHTPTTQAPTNSVRKTCECGCTCECECFSYGK